MTTLVIFIVTKNNQSGQDNCLYQPTKPTQPAQALTWRLKMVSKKNNSAMGPE